MFVIIEGLDGVGKTTVARLLAQKLHGEFWPWLQNPFRVAFQEVWKDGGLSENSEHLMFLSAFRHLSDLAKAKTAQGTTIITDRYFHCPLVVHEPMAKVKGEKPIQLDPATIGFHKPDFAFYLELDEATRLDRIQQRGDLPSPVEKLLMENPDFYQQTKENYEKLIRSNSLIQVGIDSLTPEQVANRLLSIIAQAPRHNPISNITTKTNLPKP